MTRPSTAARALAALLLVVAAACGDDDADDAGEGGAPSGDPIVIGSTLSLTGAFAATGAIHQIAGELFVDRLNDAGGLLGRPVQWEVLDDESDQARVTSLYEQLISQDQVDLVMGPYATPNILAAMAVAERHSYVLPQHTAVLAPLMTYECQFPGWSIGPEPNEFVPNLIFDALETLPSPPETVAVLTNQTGSTDFVSYGSPDDDDDAGAVSIAEDRGLDVVLEVRYPPTTTDWGPIAAQVRDANPDFVLNDALGVETVGLIEAMEQLGYRPPMVFSLFPAPGPLLGLGELSENVLSVSLFEPNDALIEDAGEDAAEIVAEFSERATDAGLPYTAFETQAAASWNAWETLVAGVEGSESLEHQDICDHLHEEGVDSTFSGQLDFPPDDNNFWPSTLGLKQIQDGDWVMVWPEDRAAAELRGPA
jgi:branched-chain amino acid transport system substrate-binding protein